jgi:hypothetical protein
MNCHAERSSQDGIELLDVAASQQEPVLDVRVVVRSRDRRERCRELKRHIGEPVRAMALTSMHSVLSRLKRQLVDRLSAITRAPQNGGMPPHGSHSGPQSVVENLRHCRRDAPSVDRRERHQRRRDLSPRRTVRLHERRRRSDQARASHRSVVPAHSEAGEETTHRAGSHPAVRPYANRSMLFTLRLLGGANECSQGALHGLISESLADCDSDCIHDFRRANL